MTALVRRRPLALLTVAAVLAEAVLGALAPGSLAGVPGEAVALVWLALAARHVVARLRPARAPRRRRAREPEDAVAPPLARLRRAVELGTAVAGDFHMLLRPALRGAAAERLRRHGVDLERDPERARRLLGDEGYALVRPDRAPPEDRFGPGPSLAAVTRLVERLEVL